MKAVGWLGLMISVAGGVWVLPVPTHAQDASASVQVGQEQKTGTMLQNQ